MSRPKRTLQQYFGTTGIEHCTTVRRPAKRYMFASRCVRRFF